MFLFYILWLPDLMIYCWSSQSSMRNEAFEQIPSSRTSSHLPNATKLFYKRSRIRGRKQSPDVADKRSKWETKKHISHLSLVSKKENSPIQLTSSGKKGSDRYRRGVRRSLKVMRKRAETIRHRCKRWGQVIEGRCVTQAHWKKQHTWKTEKAYLLPSRHKHEGTAE